MHWMHAAQALGGYSAAADSGSGVLKEGSASTPEAGRRDSVIGLELSVQHANHRQAWAMQGRPPQ